MSHATLSTLRWSVVLGVLAALDVFLWHWGGGAAGLPYWLLVLRYVAIDVPCGLLLYGIVLLSTIGLERDDSPDSPSEIR